MRYAVTSPSPSRHLFGRRVIGWMPLLVLPVLAAMATANAPRWILMWAAAFAIFCGCKWLTWVFAKVEESSIWRKLGHLFAWPGLNANAFLSERRSPNPTSVAEPLFGVGKLILGAVLLWVVTPLLAQVDLYVAGWCAMVGLVMMLHFGVFHLLSWFFRSLGVEATPLMIWPIAATSVAEFWGRRWNTAFRDLTHQFLFQPLTRKFGPKTAMAAGFLFSGLVHDIVISLPAGGGYGGPTVFFLIQLVAVFIERSRFGKKSGLGTGVRGWFFTALVLLLPAVLLFHPPFVLNVVIPFSHALGAIE